MANSNRRSSGWLRTRGANPTLGIHTEDPAVRVPYHFGLGVNDTGRLSTSTRAGAAIAFPAAYGFGEALELRYSSAKSNSNFNGIYLRVDTSVANTVGVAGIDVDARRSVADIAVGTIKALSGIAYTGNLGADSGNITNLFGVNAEASVDGSYTGTIALLAGLRVKVTTEDGMTLTKGYGVFIETDAATGGKTLTAALGVKSNSGVAYTALIDATDAVLVETDTGTVVRLITFTGANGTVYHLVHDTDSATVVAVGT